MESIVIYHDMSINSAVRIAESSSSFVNSKLMFITKSVHVILYLTDFNPHSVHRMDVDIATTSLQSEKTAPSPMEEDELCTICMDKIITCVTV
ncbi:unnamed protein product [Eruca vesicaria subsp. sativa]|uniref:Uncharacterized protein n=1 Tax=Eruca vesicaria subsp. sativa TaxID=29727 RepID=A0ABC8LHR0_ERUVS|nr:unnamed protein product [Eruca vesicaria subsp. sativa]